MWHRWSFFCYALSFLPPKNLPACWCHAGNHCDFNFWGCYMNVRSILHQDLDDWSNRDGSWQTVWTATGCNAVNGELSPCQITNLLYIHKWIGILGLEQLYEVNSCQSEWNKNGRRKQYWPPHALLCKFYPKKKPIPEGKTYLVIIRFLATLI